MTKEEEKEVIRVYGENYEESDVPAYIWQRDSEKLSVENSGSEFYIGFQAEHKKGQ
jgi:hypothetical protein